MVRYGLGAYIGFGEITGYTTNGAAGDITHWWRIEPGSVKIKLETRPCEFRPLDSYDEAVDALSDGQRWVQGQVSFPLTYQGAQNLFRFLSGHNKTPAPELTFFHYDFVPVDNTDPTHWVFGFDRHYCIELYRGDSGGNAVFYQGCVMTNVRFDFEPGSIVRMTMDFLGRGYTVGPRSTPSFSGRYMITACNMLGRVASGSPPTGTPPPVPSYQMGPFIPYRMHRGSFEVRQPLEHRWAIGDRVPQVQPKPSAKREPIIDVEIDLPDTDAYWLNLITQPVGNALTDNATLFVSEDYPHDAIWGCPKCLVLPQSQVVEKGHGVLRGRLVMQGISQFGVLPYLIGVRNQESNYH